MYRSWMSTPILLCRLSRRGDAGGIEILDLLESIESVFMFSSMLLCANFLYLITWFDLSYYSIALFVKPCGSNCSDIKTRMVRFDDISSLSINEFIQFLDLLQCARIYFNYMNMLCSCFLLTKQIVSELVVSKLYCIGWLLRKERNSEFIVLIMFLIYSAYSPLLIHN